MIFVYEQSKTTVTSIGIIEDCISYTAEQKFATSGEFQLITTFSQEYIELLMPTDFREKIVSLDGYFGLVYKVSITQDDDGAKRITATGKSLENIFSHYQFGGVKLKIKDRKSVNLVDYIYSHIVSAQSDETSIIYDGKLHRGIVFDKSDYDSYPSTLFTTYYSPEVGDTWLDFLETVTAKLGLGFNFKLTSDGHIKLNLVVPSNRSSTVMLSSEFGDVSSSSYYINSLNYYNAVIYYATNTEGSSSAGVVYASEEFSREDPSKLKIYCMITEDADVSTDSLPQFAEMWAESFLEQHKIVDVYDGDVNISGGKFIYNTDYFLGDTVRIQDSNLKLFLTAQLTAVSKTVNENGEKLTPTWGFDQITLSKLLTRKGIL